MAGHNIYIDQEFKPLLKAYFAFEFKPFFKKLLFTFEFAKHFYIEQEF